MTATDIAAVISLTGLSLRLTGLAKELTLRAFTSKQGNTCYTVHAIGSSAGRASMYGTLLPEDTFTSFPTEAVVHGVTIPLSAGVTQGGSPKMAGQTTVEIDDRAYSVRVQVSRTRTGWNLIAKAFPQGNGGSSVVDLDLL